MDSMVHLYKAKLVHIVLDYGSKWAKMSHENLSRTFEYWSVDYALIGRGKECPIIFGISS